MAVGATRTQKAKIGELTINRFTHEGTGPPAGLHLIVVPGFTTIDLNGGCSVNQFGVAQSVSGGMGQHGQPTSGMNGFHHVLGTKQVTNNGITTVIGLKRWVIELKTERQHMHQTTLEKRADLHPAPKGGNGLS